MCTNSEIGSCCRKRLFKNEIDHDCKHTRLEPESLDSLMRISCNSRPQLRKSALLLIYRRPVEALISFLKASKFSWASFVKTYQHSYGWNFRQFLFVFIYFIKRFYIFCKVVFFIDKNKKVMSRQYYPVIEYS